MADWMYCPPAGKHVRIVETPDAPTEDRVVFEMLLESDSRGPYPHVHPRQDERLEVVEGRLGVSVDGTTQVLEPGEDVEIPRGVAHKFWNEGDEETQLYGELDPGHRSHEFLPLAFALARDRPATSGGVPLNPLAVAALFDEYEDYFYFSPLPISIQKFGLRLLAPIANAAGYDAVIDDEVLREARAEGHAAAPERSGSGST